MAAAAVVGEPGESLFLSYFLLSFFFFWSPASIFQQFSSSVQTVWVRNYIRAREMSFHLDICLLFINSKSGIYNFRIFLHNARVLL